MCIYKSIGLPDNIDNGMFVQLVYSQNIELPDDIETGKFEHRVQKNKSKGELPENSSTCLCVTMCNWKVASDHKLIFLS